MSSSENVSQVTVKKDTLSFVDYISIFIENIKPILLSTLLVSLVTIVIVFFIVEPIFQSSSVVKTTSKSSGLGGLIGADVLPDLGDIGGLGGGGSIAKDLALYESILLSRRCIEETIIKFNIMEEENFKYMFDAAKYYRENVLAIKKDKIAGTMEISTFDVDPVKAKEMTSFLIFQLNKINTELNVQDARNNREFIQSRYDLVSVDLKNAEDSLKVFQNNFGIAPELQIQAAVKLEFELEAEIKSEEIKLELLKKILSSDQSEILAQEQKISALQKQLFEIQNNDDRSSNLNLKGSPDVVLNFYRLRRDVEIQNKILTTLIPLLEEAKIEENRETPTVLILDPPNVPDKKAKPKRMTVTLVFTFLAFVMTYIFFLVKNRWKLLKGIIKSKNVS